MLLRSTTLGRPSPTRRTFSASSQQQMLRATAQRAPQRAQCIQHTAPTSQAQRSRGAVQCMAQQATVAAPPATAAAATVKEQLVAALAGTDRGIFGIPAAKRAALLELISQLEATNQVPAPTQSLGMCHGRWQLLFSTITITGVKRTKLGLREFVKLGELYQDIDIDKKEASNSVEFSVAGLSMVRGGLTIRATFSPASPQRVDIQFQEATLAPPQLQKLFEANYDLLLSIFNPEGYLDITYVDDQHRVGRDDKGNVFLLQRLPPA